MSPFKALAITLSLLASTALVGYVMDGTIDKSWFTPFCLVGMAVCCILNIYYGTDEEE